MYYESTPYFSWLFNTFLQCHGSKKPRVIFTDQDKAMKAALEIIMSNVPHALCTWHLMQNAVTNLSGPLHGCMDSFMQDLTKCMYQFIDVDEFERNWRYMREKHGLVENKWLDKLYKKKGKWSIAYMSSIFTAEMRTTQLSESANGRLKEELGSGLSMKKFFDGFERFLTNTREKEFKSNFNSRQYSPYLVVPTSTILRQAAEIYTPKIFENFSEQFLLEYMVKLDKNDYINGPHVRIASDAGKSYKINFNQATMIISCSCCLYEIRGYLCGHILRVFNILGIGEIPGEYIMKRWTRQAKSGLVDVIDPSPGLTLEKKKYILNSGWSRVVSRLGEENEMYENLLRKIQKADFVLDKHEKIGVMIDENLHVTLEPKNAKVRGLKKKDGHKGGGKRRQKTWSERLKSKRPRKTQILNKGRFVSQSITGRDQSLLEVN